MLARRGAALALSLGLVGACSSDAANEPDPTLLTPGAFVAVKDTSGVITLHRTLDTFELQNDKLLFLTEYDVAPTTWEEARAIAKGHEIPIRREAIGASLDVFPGGPYQIVWFRTLTREEEERAR